jgi:hypothetical protein
MLASPVGGGEGVGEGASGVEDYRQDIGGVPMDIVISNPTDLAMTIHGMALEVDRQQIWSRPTSPASSAPQGAAENPTSRRARA